MARTDPVVQIHRILHKLETFRIYVESHKREGDITITAAEGLEGRRRELENMHNTLLDTLVD